MKNLCVFLVSGKTFSFKNITINHDNEFALSFTYKAMSDKLIKSATFYKVSLAGWSWHETA